LDKQSISTQPTEKEEENARSPPVVQEDPITDEEEKESGADEEPISRENSRLSEPKFEIIEEPITVKVEEPKFEDSKCEEAKIDEPEIEEPKAEESSTDPVTNDKDAKEIKHPLSLKKNQRKSSRMLQNPPLLFLSKTPL
jgi:hypothetical protein